MAYENRLAREMKAVRLEDAIVAAGRQQEVLDARAVPPDLRRVAVDAAGVRPPSEDTWALVVHFLTDRFGARA